MSVFYLKLVTGEEIIGETVRMGEGRVAVSDPMTLEYGEGDGRRLVYMGRYNPFVEDKTIVLDRTSVVWMRPVTVEVVEYYRSSLDYAKKVSDENFRKGMKLASQSNYDELNPEPDQESSEGKTLH